jgi:glycosyltransferase involved in cell wall biosynthesis
MVVQTNLLIISREYPPASEGGISRRLSGIIPHLLDLGINVDVVCFSGQSMFGESVHSIRPISPILYTQAREPQLSDSIKVLYDIYRLNKFAESILKSKKFNLIQIEDPVFTPFLNTNITKIVTVHTTQIGEFLSLLKSFKRLGQLKRLLFSFIFGILFDFVSLKKASEVITVGQTIKDELVKYYRVPRDKIKINPNGVLFPKKIDKKNAKSKLNINKKILIYFGRLVDRKRVQDLLYAVKILNQTQNANFILFIVGAGPQYETLKQISVDLHIDHLVQFKGYISDQKLFSLLEASDVFILPSSYEGHPITVLEAMAYGCLIITSNIDQVRDIITNNKNGLIYPVGNIAELYNALKSSFEDDGLTQRLSSQARIDSLDYSWITVANKYNEIYTKNIALEGKQ